MLVSFLPPKRVPIPHEPGEWIEFRKPASSVAKKARGLVESEGRRGVRDFGAEIVKAFNTGDDDEKAVRRARKLQAASEYDVDQFDRDTLLHSAIVDWSYVDRDGSKVPVSPDQITNNLDEATARWAHQVVVDSMKPATAEGDKSPVSGGAPSAD